MRCLASILLVCTETKQQAQGNRIMVLDMAAPFLSIKLKLTGIISSSCSDLACLGVQRDAPGL